MRLLFILFILIYGCGSCNSHQDKTTVFQKYLNNTFQKSIPQQTHYFILLPEVICEGCVSKNLEALNVFVNDNSANSHITLLYSGHENLIPATLYNKIVILSDSEGMMDKLTLNIANLTLIKTVREKVVFIRSVNTISGEMLVDWINPNN